MFSQHDDLNVSCVDCAGGSTNFLSARKHFTMSLNNQAARLNLRAVYGLVAACRAVAGGTDSVSAHEAAVNTELLRWAKSQMDDLTASRHNGGDSALGVVVSSML